MVSMVEKQMPPRHLKHRAEEEYREIPSFHGAHRRILDERSLIFVQICLHCEKKFRYKKGRKTCPYCQALLRTRTIILKAPQFWF